MIKRVFALVATVWLLCGAALLGGCAEDEVRTHRHVEIQEHVVEQHEVVE
jgi:hypothetical protein